MGKKGILVFVPFLLFIGELQINENTEKLKQGGHLYTFCRYTVYGAHILYIEHLIMLVLNCYNAQIYLAVVVFE